MQDADGKLIVFFIVISSSMNLCFDCIDYNKMAEVHDMMRRNNAQAAKRRMK